MILLLFCAAPPLDPLPPGAIARLGTARYSHRKPLTGFAVSEDGQWLAVIADDRELAVLSMRTGRPMWSFREEGRGRWERYSVIACGSSFYLVGRGAIRCFDAGTGDQRWQVEAEGPVWWGPRGAWLAHSLGAGKTVRLGPASGKVLARAADKPPTALVSADGKFIATAGDEVRLMDAATGKLLRVLVRDRGGCRATGRGFVRGSAGGRSEVAVAGRLCGSGHEGDLACRPVAGGEDASEAVGGGSEVRSRSDANGVCDGGVGADGHEGSESDSPCSAFIEKDQGRDGTP